MSCGTPVIASDLPAVRDIVVEGETGFLVRQKDPEHIAERILTVLGKVNALDDMHKAARKHVEDNFDWDVVTRRYVDIINTMWSM
jgi:glycosyltransferase involved in cell wall biosynthesis